MRILPQIMAAAITINFAYAETIIQAESVQRIDEKDSINDPDQFQFSNGGNDLFFVGDSKNGKTVFELAIIFDFTIKEYKEISKARKVELNLSYSALMDPKSDVTLSVFGSYSKNAFTEDAKAFRTTVLSDHILTKMGTEHLAEEGVLTIDITNFVKRDEFTKKDRTSILGFLVTSNYSGRGSSDQGEVSSGIAFYRKGKNSIDDLAEQPNGGIFLTIFR